MDASNFGSKFSTPMANCLSASVETELRLKLNSPAYFDKRIRRYFETADRTRRIARQLSQAAGRALSPALGRVIRPSCFAKAQSVVTNLASNGSISLAGSLTE
jgi:hypothetical protein